jgi:phosphoglycerate dehydrogenase-like enzyme
MSPAANPFRIKWTGDFHAADGTPRFRDLGTSVFAGYPHIECGAFPEHRPIITPEQIGDAQGVIVLTPRVTADSVAHSTELLALVRFGVGYDSVDVPACTRAGVLAIITAGAVDRSMAEATLTWMLALSHHVRAKDALLRAGKWEERTHYMGSELRDHTLGVIGLGGIGRALIDLLRGFGMKQPLAYDPFIDEEKARLSGARAVSLEELLTTADFVSIHCPLTEQTRNLIGRRELALMKRSAYLLNTARGGIVDENALYDALKSRQIAGAAVDCFVREPITTPHRFGELDNVLLAPHCIGWTDEMFRDIGRAACQALLDLSLGQRPRGVLNAEVFDQPGFREKWTRHRRTGSLPVQS